jgi:hypothetical protein
MIGNDAFFSSPTEEKKATYWVPNDGFDWATAGRALSDEEKEIVRRLGAVPRAAYSRAHYDQE